MMETVGEAERSFAIGNLEENTAFTFSIVATTSVGPGPSASESVTTLEAGK